MQKAYWRSGNFQASPETKPKLSNSSHAKTGRTPSRDSERELRIGLLGKEGKSLESDLGHFPALPFFVFLFPITILIGDVAGKEA